MRNTSVLAVCVVAVTILAACSPMAAATPTQVPPTQPQASPTTAEQPQPEATVANNTPIKVGVYAPMTGAIAFLGEGFQFGTSLAVKDLGGAIDGHPIQLIYADNKCNPTDAVNAVHKLIEVDQVDVIIGGGCSSATVAALPIIAEGETPAVSATSTNPGIFGQMGVGGNAWEFRVNPDDVIMAHAFAKAMADQAKSFAMVAENTDFGRGAITAYVPIFEDMGVDVLSQDFFDLGTADFRPALTKIKSENPEALLVVMTERDGSTFMRQLREVGLEAKIFSRGSLTSPLFLQYTEDAPSIGNGVLEFSFWAAGSDSKLDQEFVDEYDTSNSPHRGWSYYAMYYAVAGAIHEALQNEGVANRQTIRDALVNTNVEMPFGTIKFDDHNQAYPKGTVTTIEDGKIKFVQFVDLVPVEH
jgi:branched-chain amino acid transport system substrate-binding protein